MEDIDGNWSGLYASSPSTAVLHAVSLANTPSQAHAGEGGCRETLRFYQNRVYRWKKDLIRIGFTVSNARALLLSVWRVL